MTPVAFLNISWIKTKCLMIWGQELILLFIPVSVFAPTALGCYFEGKEGTGRGCKKGQCNYAEAFSALWTVVQYQTVFQHYGQL